MPDEPNVSKSMAEQVVEILDTEQIPPGLDKNGKADASSEGGKDGDSESAEKKDGEEKSVVEPKKEEKEPEVDPRDTTILELTRKVDELTKLVGGGKEEPEPEPEFVPEELVTAEEVEEAQYDTAKMAALLNKVFNAGRENTLKAIPTLVTATVSRQSAITNLVQDFWARNEDLREDRNYVSYVTTQVEGEHPDWSLADVLKEVEKRVRSGRAFRKTAESIEKERREGSEESNEDDPAFPSKPRGNDNRRKGTDTRSELQKQIDDVIGD